MTGVQGAASLYTVDGATVLRTDFVDPAQTSGITVYAADRSLVKALSASVASDRS